jgi:large subunit ribosomal protein L6
MSRAANNPVSLPKGVEVSINGQQVTIKGAKGTIQYDVHSSIAVTQEDSQLRIKAREGGKRTNALAGTARALLNNMVNGVAKGFERRLEIVGVGFRAQLQGRKLNLTLGYSHPITMDVPEGVTVEMPSQTEIVLRGVDKHKVGQLAANIRAFRPPEPYKGKGVKHVGEQILRKEAKKT